ncbi:MAG: hypothetical protein JKX95_07765 [Bacteroidia bacterium]|nr:hypothetical protein [Bacteroidia bacterium]
MPIFCIGQSLEKNVEQVFEEIYQFNFNTAKESIADLKKKNQNNSSIYLLEANYHWWKIIARDSLEANIDHCKKSLDNALTQIMTSKADETTKEELFKLITIYGIKARLELINENHLQVLNYLYKTIDKVKSTFDENDYPPFNLTSGLYNFYMAHTESTMPYLKPFMVLFPNGDIDIGIQQLNEARKLSSYYSTEASYFLMKIYTDYRTDLKKAVFYAEELANKYPTNMFFQTFLLGIYCDLKETTKISKQVSVIEDLATHHDQLSETTKQHFLLRAYNKIGMYHYLTDTKQALKYFDQALTFENFSNDEYFNSMLHKALIIDQTDKNAVALYSQIIAKSDNDEMKSIAKKKLKELE